MVAEAIDNPTVSSFPLLSLNKQEIGSASFPETISPFLTKLHSYVTHFLNQSFYTKFIMANCKPAFDSPSE